MRWTILGLPLLLVACGGGPTGSTCPTGSTPTYDNFGRQFFASYCDRCHAVNQAPSMRTLAEIRARRTEIDLQAAGGPNAVNTSMPESGTAPSEAERRRLGEWLACGAP